MKSGDRQWLKFEEWRKIYGMSPISDNTSFEVPGTDLAHKGDIVHITVMGQPAVILGSLKAAIDLLDVRGTIHYIFCRRI